MTYRRPPQPICDVLDAPPTPGVAISPTRDTLLLVQGVRYPPIADLAAPMLRLAGLRLDLRNNGPHAPGRIVGLTIVDLAEGSHRAIPLPVGHFGQPQYSPDGRSFALGNVTATGIELWVGEIATASVRKIAGVRLSAVYGPTLQWAPDGTLLTQLVPENRGPPPAPPEAPVGPVIQESHGHAAPVRTFADLFQNPFDEHLFDYYATAQLARIDPRTGTVEPLGEPTIFAQIDPSPSGKYLLIARICRPYSYLYPVSSFPHNLEVWDRLGAVLNVVARQPLEDRVPIEGVPTGPRNMHWQPTSPATLAWIEALDGGDPKNVVPHRDRLCTLEEPFSSPWCEVARIEHRWAGVTWSERGDWALVRDYDRDRRWGRTFQLRVDEPMRVLWSRSVQDRYGDPGQPFLRVLPNGERVLWEHRDSLFLAGAGASPEGDRPFVDRFGMEAGQSERLFHCEPGEYEAPLALIDGERFAVLTRLESVAAPPNYLVHTSTSRRALTHFTDPTPQLRGIQKRLVTYTRADGVALSFTLHLPPDYRKGTRLPTVVWAYPQEFATMDTAGQVGGSPHRFTTLTGPSHLFYLLAGYAVLDGATMPVVGDPETANDTFIEQVVDSARAAIEKAVELGVTDPARVGIGGHSYGAFMAANLLAHSDLFRAGVARSGSYNRTLTPFGFQNERRTLWEAQQVYANVSPFQFAHKIKAPLLLIHGAADNNPGTFPLQSERLFQAIRGTGGTVRYVALPLESHGYVARESIEHTLCEMVEWFDRYLE